MRAIIDYRLRWLAFVTLLAALSALGCLSNWLPTEGIQVVVVGHCPTPSTLPSGASCRETETPPSRTCEGDRPIDVGVFHADWRASLARFHLATWTVPASALPVGLPLVLPAGDTADQWWQVTLVRRADNSLDFRMNGAGGPFPRNDPSAGAWVHQIFAATPETYKDSSGQGVADLRSVMFFRPSTGLRVNRQAGRVCSGNFSSGRPPHTGNEVCTQFVHPIVEVGGQGWFHLSDSDSEGATVFGPGSPRSIGDVVRLRSEALCL